MAHRATDTEMRAEATSNARCDDVGEATSAEAFRTGFVSLIGRTNVGKSTFLNAVLGEKLLISSPKPQATRNRIRCVLTTPSAQIVFVDTPGLHRPKTRLGRQLVREAHRSLRGIDVLLYMIEPWGHVDPLDRQALERLGSIDVPLLLLVNKIDRARGNALEETLLAYADLDRFAELIPVSATRRVGLDDAVQTTISYLPVGPAVFPADVKCDRPEEFLIEEVIREKIYQSTYQEVPYSATVRLKWLRATERGRVEIKAEILVDRQSQKGILIGKGGQTVKRIGTLARAEIERLLGRRVHLELVVQVSPGWNRDDAEIRRVTAP
jgi:GTP-binding protein Era